MKSDELYPNTTQYPNWLIDKAMHLLTGNEWQVLTYIVRRTYGFRKDADSISISQIAHGNGKAEDGALVEHGTGLSEGTVKAYKQLYDFLRKPS